MIDSKNSGDNNSILENSAYANAMSACETDTDKCEMILD